MNLKIIRRNQTCNPTKKFVPNSFKGAKESPRLTNTIYPATDQHVTLQSIHEWNNPQESLPLQIETERKQAIAAAYANRTPFR
jgi:hypothetical protein